MINWGLSETLRPVGVSTNVFIVSIRESVKTRIYSQELILGGSVETGSDNNEFIISPNPVKDYITFNSKLQNGTYIFMLYSVQGEVLIDNTFKVGDFISKGDLPSGLYFYKIIQENNQSVATGKVLLE